MHGAENGSHHFTNAWRSENNETLNERRILKHLSSDQMRSRYSLHMKFELANPASMSFPRYKYGDRKLEMPDQIVRTD